MAGSFQQFLTALGQNESGNNYGFTSSLGYLGRYQFGEEALSAVGFYAGHDGTGAIDFIGAWTSTAAAYGVYDKSGFLASPAAQDAAAQAWFGQVWADVTVLGLQSYIGQQAGGVPITASGLVAGAHLVGVWALKDFLTSGGAVMPRDGYGTSVAEYVGRFGGYDLPYDGAGAAPAGPSGGGSGSPSAGDDILTGTGGEDYLHAGAGNDLIYGDGAHDDAHGNTGDDTVHGGAGDDWSVGGQGNDLVFGDDGADLVYGQLGADTLDGGAGDDGMAGGQADDVLRGGDGDDYLSGDRGADTLSGGSGADSFHASADSGLDRVLDFSPWEGDRVRLEPGAGWTVHQDGADAVVDLGNGSQIVLVGVQASALPDGWIT